MSSGTNSGCFALAGAVDSDSGAPAWDCARELRTLRDAACRSREEEASALRRRGEEVERSAMRRQMDESAALQTFLGGFHEAVEVRLERQRAQIAGRFEALERQLERDADRLERSRNEVLGEARRLVNEALGDFERSVGCFAPSAHREVASLAVPDAATFGASNQTEIGGCRGLSKVGADLRSAGELAARAVVHKVAAMWESELKNVRQELTEAVAFLRREIDERTMEVKKAKEVAEVATNAECQMATLWERVEASTRELEAFELATESAVSFSLTETNTRLCKIDARQTASDHAVAALQVGLEAASGHSKLTEASLTEFELLCCERQAQQLCEAETVHESFHENIKVLSSSIGAFENRLQGEVNAAIRVGNRGFFAELQTSEEIANEAISMAQEVKDIEATLLMRMEGLQSSLREGVYEAMEGAAPKALEVQVGLELAQLRRALELAEDTTKSGEAVAAEQVSRLTTQMSRISDAFGADTMRLSSDVLELRREMAASTLHCREAATDHAKAFSSVSANCGRLAAEITRLRQQGLTHEWTIERCLQRFEYLDITGEAGLWLDSPEFTLGCLGSVNLRIYPRGVTAANSQCAVGLRVADACFRDEDGMLRAAPMKLDFSVGGLRRRGVIKQPAEGGGTLWLATCFGSLESIVGTSSDLTVGVEVPAGPWAVLDGPTEAGPDASWAEDVALTKKRPSASRAASDWIRAEPKDPLGNAGGTPSRVSRPSSAVGARPSAPLSRSVGQDDTQHFRSTGSSAVVPFPSGTVPLSNERTKGVSSAGGSPTLLAEAPSIANECSSRPHPSPPSTPAMIAQKAPPSPGQSTRVGWTGFGGDLARDRHEQELSSDRGDGLSRARAIVEQPRLLISGGVGMPRALRPCSAGNPFVTGCTTGVATSVPETPPSASRAGLDDGALARIVTSTPVFVGASPRRPPGTSTNPFDL